MIALFFDTETTGFPREDFTPEIVQIAAIVQDTESLRVLHELNLIVTPHGIVPDDIAAIHGITTELARKVGVHYGEAHGMFVELLEKADMVVAHNLEFDMQMLELNWTSAFFKASECLQYCTMRESIDIVALPPGEYHKVDYSKHKPPKLREAYEFFTGQSLQNAHDAMADVRACRDVYFGIQAARQ
jgi:DNA polymerase-3 subunit epsilon